MDMSIALSSKFWVIAFKISGTASLSMVAHAKMFDPDDCLVISDHSKPY